MTMTPFARGLVRGNIRISRQEFFSTPRELSQFSELIFTIEVP